MTAKQELQSALARALAPCQALQAHLASAASEAVATQIDSKNEEGDLSSLLPASFDREEFVRRLRRLADLFSNQLVDPRWLLNHIHQTAALAYVHTFAIPSHIPRDGTPTTYADLASTTGTDERQLRRFVAHLMTAGIFQPGPSSNTVKHTPASTRLLTDTVDGASHKYIATTDFPIIAAVVPALRSWAVGDEDPTRTAFNFHTGEPLPFFEYLNIRGDETAEVMRRGFDDVLVGHAANPGFAMSHMREGFERATLPKEAVVVEIGDGRQGIAAVEILKANPDLRVVVQDLQVLPPASPRGPGFGVGSSTGASSGQAPALIGPESQSEAELRRLQERITFTQDNFFTAEPIAASVYFMRFILHNYPDEGARKILCQLVPQMRQNKSSLIIMEMVKSIPGCSHDADGNYPDPGPEHNPSEEFTTPLPQWEIRANERSRVNMMEEIRSPKAAAETTMDLQVLAYLNGKVRDTSEWEALLKSADPALKVVEFGRPPGSLCALIHAKIVE